MLKNYITIAFRNLLRNKHYALINIFGLAVGIAGCLLIYLVISFELSFDNFHKKKDRTYRLFTEMKTPEGINYSGGVPFPTAAALKLDYPQLEKVISVFKESDVQITIPGNSSGMVKKFKEENGVFFAQPEFFDVFDFEWLSGNPVSALSEPNTVVLTKETAERYFGSWDNAIGKTFIYDNDNNYKVTGILKDPPPNTDLPFKMIISYASFKYRDLNDWGSIFRNAHCFVVLPPGMSGDKFSSFLPAFVTRHKPDKYTYAGYQLQPLSDMHFDKRVNTYSGKTFTKDLISSLSLIAVFLLICACINFVNLATAQAGNRSKEVGVRKVLGSSKNQLAGLFLGETALITIFAVILAVGIAFVVSFYLNRLLQIPLSFNVFRHPFIIVFLVVVTILVTFLSGLYPAFILSGFNPIQALRKKVSTQSLRGASLRRILVIVQFTVAQVLIISTMVMISQIRYFKSYKLGFDKDAILNVNIPPDSLRITKMSSLRNELSEVPAISNVSLSATPPADDNSSETEFIFDKAAEKADFNVVLKWADVDYFKTYGLKMVAGRIYAVSDTLRELVVNETFLKKLGIRTPEEALGKFVTLWGGRVKLPIVGVVRDFNVLALHDGMQPVIMGTRKRDYEVINIKLAMSDVRPSLNKIERLWNQTFPDFIYEFKFLDEKINDFYAQESQMLQLYKMFSIVLIFISCMGLYGLVSFMAIQRTKEMGIRKVLGASTSHILYLFSREFTLLIIIAFFIAAPLAGYLMNNWLEKFSYRIGLGITVFIVAIGFSLLVSWLAVSYQALKTAAVNPIKSLRAE